MDLRKAAIFGTYIAKDYAEDILRLLVSYRDISASEAASRLNLHIRTVQDFLEAMATVNIVKKEEVYEKKRPYNRYSLNNTKIRIEIDLSPLYEGKEPEARLAVKIRERKNAGARFNTARYDQWISSVVIWIGEGRDRKERKINLTVNQGKFLYNLPFPNAAFQSIAEIMRKAGVNIEYTSEILDTVDLLTEYQVIEKMKSY
jgi:hypothetical protein